MRLLVGRPLAELYPRRGGAFGAPVLRLDQRAVSPATPRAPAGRRRVDVSLEVRAGEIVGLAGIMGAGRTELLSALYGAAGPGDWSRHRRDRRRTRRADLDPAARARGARLCHRRSARQRPDAARQRRAQSRRLGPAPRVAVLPDVEIARDASSPAQAIALSTCARRGRRLAVGALSGGNQQKVVLAKEVLGEPRLLLLDEPTRGVDVGAKGEIYARIRELAAQGVGVLIASSEMPELLGLCDRVVVLRRGRTVAEFPGRRR